MPVLSIPEVVLAILARLPASKRDDTSASCMLREVAQTDSLWRKHYRARWTWPRMPDTNEGVWYKLYCLRRARDIEFRYLLDVISRNPSRRGDAASVLCGYERYAWDMLRIEAECRVPEGVSKLYEEDEEQSAGEQWDGFGEEWVDGTGRQEMEAKREDKLDTREIEPDWIQRRWWAKHALEALARLGDMTAMMGVFSSNRPDPMSVENARRFEQGMISLSGLMGINTFDIGHNFDSLAHACKNSLIQGGIEVDATSSKFDLKRFSKSVCDWMRSQGFVKTQGSQSIFDSGMIATKVQRAQATNYMKI
ncbi:hemimethylated DNA-binding domain protein [Ceratobasidium sp. AG-Ba]|nr:hemimethylated DNA-binding domain protein [Ceratobasidium sp. AG-Ba]